MAEVYGANVLDYIVEYTIYVVCGDGSSCMRMRTHCFRFHSLALNGAHTISNAAKRLWNYIFLTTK